MYNRNDYLFSVYGVPDKHRHLGRYFLRTRAPEQEGDITVSNQTTECGSPSKAVPGLTWLPWSATPRVNHFTKWAAPPGIPQIWGREVAV
ncbi:hypothetical protein AVEN_116060-1 [Araneus ventricosus]|uniref:Uncharacterized protein n=1 Tax=Araneus ventricosus TaxID=182803 RepID=A0A4Y2W275_ARAVE|nr:hypothetical protein AVEN_112177-1 [Araneus ventricosus]GBO30646.1 hypothetical protein AVEN_116060-1 [Araneus ventricosus]